MSGDFTDAEMQTFQSAANRWSVFSGRPVVVVRGEGDTCHISAVESLGDNPSGEASHYAETRKGSGNIRVARMARGPALGISISHEIGHALGLDHVDDAKAVMHAQAAFDADDGFTTADAVECRRVGWCL